MNVTYACPRCEQSNRREWSPEQPTLACENCRQELQPPASAFEGGQLRRCLVCPSTDLFVRKDFPQRLGVTIVVLGLAASCIPWYYSRPLWTFAVLFATALCDLVLYFTMGNALTCYRCGTQYRGLDERDRHGGFDLTTHERYRQQAARLAETKDKAPRAPVTG
jgi:hypothetical protein